MTPYSWYSVSTRPLITEFSPGQSPPQVTIAARVMNGGWKIFSRGPARSIVGIGRPFWTQCSTVARSEGTITRSSGPMKVRRRRGLSTVHSPNVSTVKSKRSGSSRTAPSLISEI